MISWMQKHNKYLVITIWIATIAFVGAGFLGWGSYSSNSNKLYFGKIGSEELSIKEFRFFYRKLYQNYSDIFQGKFDQEQAKKFQLKEQVISSMIRNAYILNIAKEFNIIVSEKEVLNELLQNKKFYENNSFNKKLYLKYLKNSNLNANDFEEIVKSNLILEKFNKLLNVDFLKEDKKILSIKHKLIDDIKYTIIKNSDIKNFKIDEEQFKAYWESNKNRFKTEDKYKFNILWIEQNHKEIISESIIDDFFKKNSFKYKTDEGAFTKLKDVKDLVISDIRLLNSKKNANINYVKYKNNDINTTLEIEYSLNHPSLSKEIVQDILKMKIGNILKPKIIDKKYAILKLLSIKKSRLKTFSESKDLLIEEFKEKSKRDELFKIANKNIKNKNYLFSETLLNIQYNNIEKLNIKLDSKEKKQFY